MKNKYRKMTIFLHKFKVFYEDLHISNISSIDKSNKILFFMTRKA